MRRLPRLARTDPLVPYTPPFRSGPGGQPFPGNMFVPINLLKPIMGDLLDGAQTRAPRPWLGMYKAEAAGHVFVADVAPEGPAARRSEEHTSELQSIMRNSYAVFCLK